MTDTGAPLRCGSRSRGSGSGGMDRTAYIVRRLLLMIPTFIGITVLCFSLTRFLPGGPVELRLMRQLLRS